MDDYNCVLPAGNTCESYLLLWISSSSLTILFFSPDGIPFFLQTGANETSPIRCNCSLPSGQSPNCDNFDFLAGILVYDTALNQTALNQYSTQFQPFIPIMEFFYLPPEIGVKEMNDAIFEPAWIATKGQTYPQSQFYNAAHRAQLYDFSSTESFGTGSMVVFWLNSEFDHAINFYNRQLKNGACSNQLSSPNFNSFYSNSWGPLEEDYYQCTQNTLNALIAAAGIASGAATLMASISTIILVTVFTRYKSSGLGVGCSQEAKIAPDPEAKKKSAADMDVELGKEATSGEVDPPKKNNGTEKPMSDAEREEAEFRERREKSQIMKERLQEGKDELDSLGGILGF